MERECVFHVTHWISSNGKSEILRVLQYIIWVFDQAYSITIIGSIKFAENSNFQLSIIWDAPFQWENVRYHDYICLIFRSEVSSITQIIWKHTKKTRFAELEKLNEIPRYLIFNLHKLYTIVKLCSSIYRVQTFLDTK